ncbi:MAG: hypothetical protein Q4C95_07780 [Planctomycetia bacterium]|nr:hypothetical protein [Planctomycetia bacterium]
MSREAQSSRKSRSIELCFRLIGIVLFSTLFLIISDEKIWGAVYKTPNFIVKAESADFAKEVAETAEQFRLDLAKLWLGTVMPQWGAPCQIQVEVSEHLGAGGNLSFTFDKGEVFGWSMTIQGSRERILDSVIPHEITHTIFASYLREPVPRWIDEGAATSVESQVERANYRNMLIGFLKEKRGIPFLEMIRLKEYPKDSKDMLTFYSQGFSVCEYLILIGGHRRLIEFAQLGVKSGNWNHALKKFYDFDNLGELQLNWTQWINQWYSDFYLAGRPDQFPPVQRLAAYQPSSNEITAAQLDQSRRSDSELNSIVSMTNFSQNDASLIASHQATVSETNLSRIQSLDHSIASEDWGNGSLNLQNIFENGVGSTIPYFSARESGKSDRNNDAKDSFVSNDNLGKSMVQKEWRSDQFEYQGSYGTGITLQTSGHNKSTEDFSTDPKSDNSSVKILAQQKD